MKALQNILSPFIRFSEKDFRDFPIIYMKLVCHLIKEDI